MDDKRLVRISKYLSKYLRHEPHRLGLTLAPGGWVPVEQLLAAAASAGMVISRQELSEVVARNNKQRFSFDATGELIRANQGHSVDVDLQLEPVVPPEVLYHGTAEHILAAIRRDGLLKMSRHHVHLSADLGTARRVGARHGRPIIFEVAARAMHEKGYTFYRSDNGVWLTDHVPPAFLRQLDNRDAI
jgi:putative RNA 2'-phosphotransferase